MENAGVQNIARSLRKINYYNSHAGNSLQCGITVQEGIKRKLLVGVQLSTYYYYFHSERMTEHIPSRNS